MGPKLKIAELVIQRLNERKSPFLGELYGILHENTLIIVSFTLKYVEEQEEVKYRISENNFPTEIDLYGVVSCTQHIKKFTDNLPLDISNVFKDVVVTDNPILLSYGYLDKESNVQAFFNKNGVITATSYDIIPESEIWQQFVLVRLNIPLNFICHNVSQDKEDLIDNFSKKVSSGAAMFHVEQSDIYLTSNNAEDVSNGKGVTNVLCSESSSSPLLLYLKKICKEKNDTPVIVNVDVLMKTTCGKHFESSPKRALAIQHVTKIFEGIQGSLNLDSLIMFQKSKTEKHLYNALVDSVCRILKLVKQSFFIYENIPPEIYHFYPSYLGHFVTLVYPLNISDDDLTDSRKYVHIKFNLLCDRPIFRRSVKYSFQEKKNPEEILNNVHVGLPPSGINGTISMVQGTYSYFHYMHGNFNDNGWGCAYRSLQTLFSWYKHQGWTDHEIPTLREIQQKLVEIKDKPKAFLGSRNWIGSFEVSYVLDVMLSVTCRMLNVAIGESVADYAHDLANHFKKHGTPVMIGGGVLAHTILGIEINDETDEVKFLVLDPHFTGPDQLNIIQSKGWIGWKNADFWGKDAFYNMCLPYRKMGV
ncbi:ufm1-specific protease 2 [Planococcus citri]|uniref:ufm1-specific protease 2 n=1 Tax=Planococcus citri TaxID=170843 RepID=UPI0031F9C2A4